MCKVCESCGSGPGPWESDAMASMSVRAAVLALDLLYQSTNAKLILRPWETHTTQMASAEIAQSCLSRSAGKESSGMNALAPVRVLICCWL